MAALSAKLTPEVVAGFGLDGLAAQAALTPPQKRLIGLSKTFAVHKMKDADHLPITARALAVYGELDRAVAGLLPLQEIPVEEFKIPDLHNILWSAHAVTFFAQEADRPELAEALAGLRGAPAFYDPTPATLSAGILRGVLDRYVEALFTTPKYEPFSSVHYPAY